jgi:N-acetyl sugar amidotransferase
MGHVLDDVDGVCNHCYRYDAIAAQRLIPLSERPAKMQSLVDAIKRDGQGKEYDCIIGVSGGVDSTYVAYLTHEMGLRPLAIHFDNGWNSELAVANIEKALKKLNIDLYSHVVNWPEFRDLQLSFLKASTPDGEVPTDHAIVALLYRMAVKYRLKHVLLGINVNSEAVMPRKWGYGYSDFRYISGVHRQFGKVPLKTYPYYTLPQLFGYMFVRKIQLVPILDYIDYQKESAMQTIQNELGWVYYGGKHYESIYTRFYQSYILPRKFNIDKRRAHFANLVLSGQMEREAALTALEAPVYHEQGLVDDLAYAIKKLGLSEADFDQIMSSPPKTFMDYLNNFQRIEKAKSIVNLIRSL